jgi:transposase
MSGPDLLDCPGVRVTDLAITADAVTVHAESTATNSACPRCGVVAARAHSRYTRTVADLPVHGRRATLVVTARRFFVPVRRGTGYAPGASRCSG